MYRVHLHQFEGPLDLLLFFIRRDELDIYDIPIGEIAEEFLVYVRFLKEVDLDSSGEFLYMASLLVNIKARMLLPGQEVDEEGEPIDPRTELVERLLEYVRYKEATESLESKWEQRATQFTRGSAAAEMSVDPQSGEDLLEATVFDLVSALKRVLSNVEDEESVHGVASEAYTLEEQCDFLRAVLVVNTKSSFVSLVTGKPKAFIISTFLAVLELAKNLEIDIFLQGTPEDFFVELKDVKSVQVEA